jgi:hypothetical protein
VKRVNEVNGRYILELGIKAFAFCAVACCGLFYVAWLYFRLPRTIDVFFFVRPLVFALGSTFIIVRARLKELRKKQGDSSRGLDMGSGEV